MKFIKSKKVIIAAIAVLSALIIAGAAFFIVSQMKPWVAKIDSKRITLEQFDKYYYAHNKGIYNVKTKEEVDKIASNPMEVRYNPLVSRKNFLDELIMQELVYDKAQDEGVTDSDEFKAILQLQEDSLVAAFFFKTEFEDKIIVTDEEIEAQYNVAKNTTFKGATLEQAAQTIKQQIQQQKLMKQSEELINSLKAKASISKNEATILALSDADAKKRPTSGWVVKIDGEEISVKEFENFYYAQNMNAYSVSSREEMDKIASDPAQVAQNKLLTKSLFLDEVVKQKLIRKRASKDKLFDNEDLTAALDLQKKSLTIWYYTKVKFDKEVEVSEAEVSDYYQRNIDRFKGVPVASAEQYIKQGIKGEKIKSKTQEFVSNLKDEAKIERDLNVLNNKK